MPDSGATVRNNTVFTSSGGRLAMILANVSSETSPLVPMWITTVLPSRPAARRAGNDSDDLGALAALGGVDDEAGSLQLRLGAEHHRLADRDQ